MSTVKSPLIKLVLTVAQMGLGLNSRCPKMETFLQGAAL